MPKDNRLFPSAFNKHCSMIFIIISLIFFIMTDNVYAHKVYIFAWSEGDMIHSESYSGGKKVKDGLIKVYDISGNLLFEGKTDAEGKFSFKNPQKSDLRIVLEAGMGHRAEYIFENEEVEHTSHMQSSVKPRETDIHTTPIEGLSKEDIRKIMEEVVDEKISPLSKRLVRMEEDKNPGFTEIIGGIGYIIGIMGIVLYFKNRKS